MQNIETKHIILLFDGRIGEHVSTKVLLGATPEGYYIAVMDVTNNLFVSQEWYKLKSFVDGKKKYIH